MKQTVGVAELRQNLSRYLRRVEQGERLLVTDHNRPVAELGPPPSTGRALDRLIAEGLVSPPTRRRLPGPVAMEGIPMRSVVRSTRSAASAESALFYADASALVKLVRDEPESPALRAFIADADLASCDLVLAEVPRAIRRAAALDPRLDLEVLVARAGEVIDSVALVPLDRALLLAAGALSEPRCAPSTRSTWPPRPA